MRWGWGGATALSAAAHPLRSHRTQCSPVESVVLRSTCKYACACTITRATESCPDLVAALVKAGWSAFCTSMKGMRAFACATTSTVQPFSARSRGFRPTALAFARPTAASRHLSGAPPQPSSAVRPPAPALLSSRLRRASFPVFSWVAAVGSAVSWHGVGGGLRAMPFIHRRCMARDLHHEPDGGI